ncbi:MAG: hypothetical protein Kow0092_25520 [Deferrisomatales bacterium]
MTYCQRCGVELAPGSLKYLVTIHVTADFDGVLPDRGDMEDLEAFMRRLDAADPEAAERDVHQSQGYLLCPACKRSFLDDPLGLEPAEGSAGEGGRVH